MTRRVLLVLGLVGLIVALATVLSRLVVPRPITEISPPTTEDLSSAPPADLLAVPPPSAPEVRVLRVAGDVVAMRGNAADKGDRRPLHGGDPLSAEDRIRTGPGASATLEMGSVAEIELAGNTQLTVGELTRELSKARLEDGRLSARVQGGRKGRLRIEVAGSDAVAESERGEFSMLSSGRGQVAVAAVSGSVALTARSKTVQIDAGQLSIVRGATPPTEPMKIPGTLFLKVASPALSTQRVHETTVRGTTSPGAIVSIGSVRVGADASGVFEARVPLKDGANALAVEVEDAVGRRTRQALSTITVDSKPPAVETDVKW